MHFCSIQSAALQHRAGHGNSDSRESASFTVIGGAVSGRMMAAAAGSQAIAAATKRKAALDGLRGSSVNDNGSIKVMGTWRVVTLDSIGSPMLTYQDDVTQFNSASAAAAANTAFGASSVATKPVVPVITTNRRIRKAHSSSVNLPLDKDNSMQRNILLPDALAAKTAARKLHQAPPSGSAASIPASEQQSALAVHNTERANHQAPPLVWNDTLAGIAQVRF